jgi:hypothetical protein
LIADRQSSSLNIVNVVPVVHDNLSLNITLETALLQVHMSWCIGHVDCRLIHIVNIDHLSLLVSILQMICCEIRRKSFIRIQFEFVDWIHLHVELLKRFRATIQTRYLYRYNNTTIYISVNFSSIIWHSVSIRIITVAKYIHIMQT